MALTDAQACCRALVHQGRIHEVLQVKFSYTRCDLDDMHDLWFIHDFDTLRNPEVAKLPVSASFLAETLVKMTGWDLLSCERHICSAGFGSKGLNDFGPAALYEPDCFAALPFDADVSCEGPPVQLREDAQLGAAIIFYSVPSTDAAQDLHRLVTDWNVETGRA